MTFTKLSDIILGNRRRLSNVKSKNNESDKIISKSQQKLLDAAEVISNILPQEIGFVCRSTVYASLPHSKVNNLQYTRKSNKIALSIIGNELAGGVPYGTYPRLILSWLASEVVKTQSREVILGESLSDFMKSLGLFVTGGKWGTIARFKEQLKRLFSSTISVTYEEKENWVYVSMNIADKALIFWDPNAPEQIDLFKSKILLSENFYNEIIKAPIPVDIRAINALKDSSLALDIYCWLTYRMSYVKNSVIISFDNLQVQFGAGYAETPHGKYEFKRKFLMQLKKVMVIYPRASVMINQDHIILKPSPSHIRKKYSIV